MSDDRPSIAELQRLHEIMQRPDRPPPYIRNAASAVLATATPVLLEIAAAARAFRDARCSTQGESREQAGDGLCFESIHCESCPVEIALEQLRAAAGKVMP